MSRKRKQHDGSMELFEGACAPPDDPTPPASSREDEFFEEPLEQSLVKTRIVTQFFRVWCNVMASYMRINARTMDWGLGYVDLFAGPGRYRDGTDSTPLIVTQQVLEDPSLAHRFQLIFNEGREDYHQHLRTAVTDAVRVHPNGKHLQRDPIFWNTEVSDDMVGRLRPHLQGERPTFFFIDPFGYVGLTHALIDFALDGFGNDCVFFFNYSRINRSLEHDPFAQEVDRVFGPRALPLRDRLKDITAGDPDEHARQREEAIMEELAVAMQGDTETPRFVLPFGFKSGAGKRTSHYLVFVSKHIRGHEIMKNVMAKESAVEAGVPTFCFSPAGSQDLPILSGLHMPEHELATDLLTTFADQRLRMSDVYERRERLRPTRFLKNHYKAALIRLEDRGRITADPTAFGRPTNTMSDDVVVTFSARTGP